MLASLLLLGGIAVLATAYVPLFLRGARPWTFAGLLWGMAISFLGNYLHRFVTSADTDLLMLVPIIGGLIAAAVCLLIGNEQHKAGGFDANRD